MASASTIMTRNLKLTRAISRINGMQFIARPISRNIPSRHASISNLVNERRWHVRRPSPILCKSAPRASSHTDVTKLSTTFQHRSFHQLFRLSTKSPSSDTNKTSNSTDTPEPNPAPILQRLTTSALPITRHENIYTLPNILTFTRLLSAPAIAYFILTSQPVTALALFTYAGITDLLDGWLARRFNSFTVVGSVIDPMADKTLMMATTLALYYSGVFPWWLLTIIVGRDVGLAISAIYFRWISLPPPKTMTRYWDFSLPSAEVKPTEISKINTMLQLLLVGNAMVLPTLPETLVEAWNLYGVFEGWMYLVAGTTVWSGLSYVGSKDAVKILSQEEGERRKEETIKKLKGEK